MSAETALRRALVSLLTAEGVVAIIENIQSRPWASVTFRGTRHELRLRLSGGAVVTEIGEREFDLPGHIVVDIEAMEIGCDGQDVLLAVEALTVEAD